MFLVFGSIWQNVLPTRHDAIHFASTYTVPALYLPVFRILFLPVRRRRAKIFKRITMKGAENLYQ